MEAHRRHCLLRHRNIPPPLCPRIKHRSDQICLRFRRVSSRMNSSQACPDTRRTSNKHGSTRWLLSLCRYTDRSQPLKMRDDGARILRSNSCWPKARLRAVVTIRQITCRPSRVVHHLSARLQLARLIPGCHLRQRRMAPFLRKKNANHLPRPR